MADGAEADATTTTPSDARSGGNRSGGERKGGGRSIAAGAPPANEAERRREEAQEMDRIRRRRRQPQPAAAEEQPPPPLLDSTSKILLTFLFLQLLTKFGSRYFPQDPSRTTEETTPPLPSSRPPVADDDAKGAMKPRGVSTAAGAGRRRGRPPPPRCVWDKGSKLSLSVFVSESSDVDWDPTTDGGARDYPSLASWIETDLVYDTSGLDDDFLRRNATLIIPVTERLKNNATGLYAHVELRRIDADDDERRGEEEEHGGGDDDRRRVLRKVMGLTRHRVRKRTRDEKNLLGRKDDSGNDDDSQAAASASTNTKSSYDLDASPLTIASLDKSRDQTLLYAKPTLHLQIVDLASSPPFPNRKSIPPQIGDHMDWVGEGTSEFELSSAAAASSEEELYYPILYRSEFWTTKDGLKEVNGTVDEIEVEVSLEPVSMWKWQLMSGMEQSWKRQEEFTGEDDGASDVLRTMLLDTNPYLLGITAIVSVLHTLFDFLAFKNDISFFRKSKSMAGLSVRTMIVNVFFQAVIFLYLADNDTSYMVLASNGVGLVIELWKASKAVKVSFDGGGFTWKEAQGYGESKTKEYDEIATGHLLYVTTPLVSGYGMYSLRYQTHRGWYSWILNTLVGFIYMFGFVMMTPQLFINYKLQSVAHLNWRTLTYKSLNTFVDDLFAFVIKMPIMHRLACLRDDAVFFVYLYQRYKYRTDYARVNEYGQCDKPTEEMLRERDDETEERKEEEGEEAEEEEPAPKGELLAYGARIAVRRRRRGAREKRG